jgi:hypothetical protein
MKSAFLGLLQISTPHNLKGQGHSEKGTKAEDKELALKQLIKHYRGEDVIDQVSIGSV